MKKTFMRSLILALMLVFVTSTAAFAATKEETTKVVSMVNSTNIKIQGEINFAQFRASILSKSNYDKNLDLVINMLIAKTNDLASKMVNYAAQYGIIVQSEWVPVKVGSRMVLVDPLIIAED